MSKRELTSLTIWTSNTCRLQGKSSALVVHALSMNIPACQDSRETGTDSGIPVLWTTPFGFPVLPEVKSRNSGSSASTQTGWQWGFCPATSSCHQTSLPRTMFVSPLGRAFTCSHTSTVSTCERDRFHAHSLSTLNLTLWDSEGLWWAGDSTGRGKAFVRCVQSYLIERHVAEKAWGCKRSATGVMILAEVIEIACW